MRLIQIGLGLWGLNWAHEVLPRLPEILVQAHVDGSKEARERAVSAGLPQERVVSSLEHALELGEADAVLATVPLDAHAAVCKNALSSALHVLVEKPFCPTLAEARELVDLAGRRNLHLAVNQNYRYFSHPQSARRLLQDGLLGKAQAMRVVFSRMFDQHYRYFFLEQPLLSDMAIHHFDLMRFILQEEPLAVTCQTWSETGTPFMGPPAAMALVEFPNGIKVNYFGSWIARGTNSAYGGQWVLDGTKAQACWEFRGDSSARHSQDRFDITPALSPDFALEPVQLTDRLGVLAAFAKLVDSGIADPELSTGKDNLGSLALMERAIQSAQQGGLRLEIPPCPIS